MNEQKLDKWADLLLDTGKRNNLINFKDTKLGTVDVIFPNFLTLFNKAEHSGTFEIFDPKLEEDDSEAESKEEDDLDEADDEKNKKILSAQETLNLYGKKLKNQHILLYNSTNKPFSALKSICKKAQSAIEETGVNIAYLSFGFIHWFENENSEYEMRAPILLVPIAIANESAIEPYTISVTDDEIIVNPTFSFKLHNDYGIKLPEFEDDIEEYFNKIEELISKLKWKISKEVKLATFSFQKINMYKDIKDNGKTIVKNTNIRSLLGDPTVESSLGQGESNKKIDLLDLHNVVDADSSQAEAIELVLQGKSFVLQGPPGTGKSQTITNIIAECLLNDKKVLFVSEKLAALNVVYEKLKNVGLEEFCLELHSHKANKNQVIAELCHTLKLHKSGISDQAEKELRSKKEIQKKLDDYTTELHKVHPKINKSLYSLYEEASSCRKAPNMEFVIQGIREKGEDYFEKAESALNKYVEYTSSIGYDYRKNCWYGYSNHDCSFQSVMQVKSDLLSISSLCKKLQEISKALTEKYGIEANTLAHAYAFRDFFNLAKESEFITASLLNAYLFTHVRDTIKEMIALSNIIIENKSKLNELFDEDIYELDGHTTYKKLTKQFSGFFSRLFNKEYKQILKSIKLCKKDGKKPTYKVAVQYAELLSVFQQKLKDFNELQQHIQQHLGQGYQGVNTDFDQLLMELNKLDEILKSGITFEALYTMDYQRFSNEKMTFEKLANEYNNALNSNLDAEKRLSASFNHSEFDFYNVLTDVLISKCENCYQSIDKLDNWCEFAKLLVQLEELDLRSFVNKTIDEKINSELIASAFKKAFNMQWIDLILHDSAILLSLSRISHDEAVRLFREKDKLHFEINKAKIKATLSAKRPNLDMIAQGSSISVLLREGEKKRKKKSIRALLSEIGDLAQVLKPCFLMSPLSVSTYLSSDIQFDVVIFDEASQIFPQDAVGAIYRGKQLIVVGDSRQMPPSNFFNSSVEIDLDDEDEDVTDFESILDMCATVLPQRRLKWHYRSRYEQLISFSNKNFYENDLITFPSSKNDEIGIGVDYVYVDGIFDRKSKTNRIEAEKIVDMVFEHIDRYPNRSLGVVAFSVAQQTLIDKLISKRRQEDPSREYFFKSDKLEPFFVKNLETVQGDERDTIIFSIAYAKDAQGRLLLNFGPINRQGGERRLNVAITRAKFNVKLVSSMHYSDIDLSSSKSVGAKLLREYLDYAENGAIALDRSISVNRFEHFDSDFEVEVCDFLRENGYSVDTQVGCSSFKIDLAVKRPDTSDYVLAVECDGASYHSSKTARDRDRLRQDILERMGWNFYRVWSTDWFKNNQVEKERLLDAVKKAFKNEIKKSDTSKGSPLSFEQEITEEHFDFPIYKTVNVDSIGAKFRSNFLGLVKYILETEAPLSEEWLLKRIVHLFDREKVTNVVRSEFNEMMYDCRRYGIIRKNGFLYLQGMEIPMLRIPSENSRLIREVKYISIEELANGMKEILRRNISVEKKGLFQLIVQKLGFSRMGDTILERLEAVLNYISPYIIIEGDIISLK